MFSRLLIVHKVEPSIFRAVKDGSKNCLLGQVLELLYKILLVMINNDFG